MAEVLALIPARGGSKGIPRKNLQLLAGAPLVVHAIRAACAARSVTRIVLSTDDEEIAAVGRAAGAELLRRPAELASDAAPTIPVLQHALEALQQDGTRFAAIVLLEPTSPFRTGALVDECVGKLLGSSARTVITVTQLERNPRNIFAVSGDDARFFVEKPDFQFTRRQDFRHLKRLNGCIYAMRPGNVTEGRILQEPIKVVEMPAEASINIDTPFDLETARLCLQDGGLSLPEPGGP